MHLLPYLEYRISSKRTPEEIYGILKSVTDSERHVFSRSHAEFVGEVHPLAFKIIGNINYRNSFVPVIKGGIKETEDGAVIDMEMRLSLFVRIFLASWFGMSGFFFLIGILCIIVNGKKDILLSVVSGCFIIAGQLMARCGFYIPAKKLIWRLEQLLG